MSHPTMKSDLLVDLSADEQQLLSGGQGYRRRPIICYAYRPYYRPYQGRGGRDIDVDVDVDRDVDVDVDRRRRF